MAYPLIIFPSTHVTLPFLSCKWFPTHQKLISFPTRRSSDLLLQRLAHLRRDQSRELLGAGFVDVGDTGQDRCPSVRRGRAPAGEGGVRAAEHVLDVAVGQGGEFRVGPSRGRVGRRVSSHLTTVLAGAPSCKGDRPLGRQQQAHPRGDRKSVG